MSDSVRIPKGRHPSALWPPRPSSSKTGPWNEGFDEDKALDIWKNAQANPIYSPVVGATIDYTKTAPSNAAAQMVESIVRDQKRVFPCCVWLQGEYGLKDIHMGAPVILGRKGVERIIELKLNAEEMELVKSSAKAVKEVMDVLDNMGSGVTA